jgi:hypothetical protein
MCAGNSAYHWSISLHNYRKTLRVRAAQVWPQDLSINPESCQMFPNGRRAESGNPKQIPRSCDEDESSVDVLTSNGSGKDPNSV